MKFKVLTYNGVWVVVNSESYGTNRNKPLYATEKSFCGGVRGGAFFKKHLSDVFP